MDDVCTLCQKRRDALEWLVNLLSGVSMGGPNIPITENEWEDAIAQAMKLLSKGNGECEDGNFDF